MLYQLKVSLLKPRSVVRRIALKLGRLSGFDNNMPSHKDLIKEYAPGKSFLDVGCMWGVNGRYAFLAEECGAKRIVGVDVYPESQEFLVEKKRRNSSVEFVQGDIHLEETLNRIGVCNIVFCSGVLYHTPDPFFLLSRLHSTCDGLLMLNTAIIPELPGIRNGGVFYPFLEKEQRDLWVLHEGMQKAVTGPYEPESGYGNWFWGMSPSCVESLLSCAGFKVEQRYLDPFFGWFICRPGPAQFAPVSGKWITRQDKEFLQFKR